jgi:hypothetical protein
MEGWLVEGKELRARVKGHRALSNQYATALDLERQESSSIVMRVIFSRSFAALCGRYLVEVRSDWTLVPN